MKTTQATTEVRQRIWISNLNSRTGVDQDCQKKNRQYNQCYFILRVKFFSSMRNRIGLCYENENFDSHFRMHSRANRRNKCCPFELKIIETTVSIVRDVQINQTYIFEKLHLNHF